MHEILLILPVFKILLLILKIIGIAVLSVIGLVVLILLIVSWVPVRYDADVEKKDAFRLSAGVTWFLRAVSFRFHMNEEGSGTSLKLFGKELGNHSEEEEEKKDEAPGEKAAEDASKPPEESSESPPESEETGGPESPAQKEDSGPKEEKDSGGNESAGEAPPEEKAGEDSSSPEGEAQEEPGEPVFIDEKIDDLLDGLQTKYLLLENRWEDLSDKYDFLTCEHATREYGRLFRNIGKILKHLLPNSLTGHLRFGFDSPAVTGKILAYYCAAAPVHRYSLIPEPEFTKKVFEGDAAVKGRIFLGYILLKILAVALNRDALYLIFNYRKHFRKSQEE